MPAPKRPNTARATETVIRRGDETAAARLRAHGWLVVEPEKVDAVYDGIRASIRHEYAGINIETLERLTKETLGERAPARQKDG